ncbi:hypothetical protein MHM88_08265 [Epibacterium sp. MM17-32]|uniref:hypothetical protein n=1 Tax=Epibacterium sp. MM17-32 TaxID=2917734 RepID=UPI001EF494DD|nr:hypothetical protein [Epibacterium sp. MM17-32]MCG7627796.1 hypothetical protein [Epibacterium sp. MM17-32]
MTTAPTAAATRSAGSARPVIDTVLHKFVAGAPDLMSHLADDIDFRIDHYADDVDASWQAGHGIDAMGRILGRLATDVFPRGTEALEIHVQPLSDGWHLTRFHQQFYYGVKGYEVTSLTYILSHEKDGKLDYFRETVTGALPL